MSMILGMDLWVFAAWIGTIIVAIICVLYGIYYKYIKKDSEEKEPVKRKETK